MAKDSRVSPANETDELKLEQLRRALIEGEEAVWLVRLT